MMRSLFIKLVLLLLFISLNGFSQEMNKKKIDEKSQMEVLTGLCNREGLKTDLFKTYYEAEYASYIPEATTLAKIKSVLVNKNILITIVMGSWCGDSQEQVPRFYKILDQINYSDSNVTLYCVDRTKKTEQGETDAMGIQLVPTFIFFENGIEIGRITETPKINLEKDFLEIIS